MHGKQHGLSIFLSNHHIVCGDEYHYCYWIQSLFTCVCLYVVENTTIQPMYTMKQPHGPPCITWKTMWSLCFLLKLHIFGGYQYCYCYCYWIQSLLICVAHMYVVVSTCTPSPPHTFIELVMTVPILSMARDQSTIWVMTMKMTATWHPQSKRALLYNSSQ